MRETTMIFWTLITIVFSFLLAVEVLFSRNPFWLIFDGTFLSFAASMLVLEFCPDLVCRAIGHDWVLTSSSIVSRRWECLRCGKKVMLGSQH